MAGYNEDLVLDVIFPKIRDQLLCGVCKSVFNDPLVTSCCHTYCRQCIAGLVATSPVVTTAAGLETCGLCPECRQQLKVRTISDAVLAAKNQVRLRVTGDPNPLRGVVVGRNLKLKEIIDKLVMKCETEGWNCPHVCAIASVATHLDSCANKQCNNCEQTVPESVSEHDCVVTLKKRLNESLVFNETVRRLAKKRKLSATERASNEEYVRFGGFKTLYVTFDCKQNTGQIDMSGVRPNSEGLVAVSIKWTDISRVIITKDDMNVGRICIRPTKECAQRLNGLLGLNTYDKRIDTESIDPLLQSIAIEWKGLADSWAQRVETEAAKAGCTTGLNYNIGVNDMLALLDI